MDKSIIWWNIDAQIEKYSYEDAKLPIRHYMLGKLGNATILLILDPLHSKNKNRNHSRMHVYLYLDSLIPLKGGLSIVMRGGIDINLISW